MQNLIAIYMADRTCGEACWGAHQDVCKCSCAGRNHGIHRVEGEDQPTRTRRVQGRRYRLYAVAERRIVDEIESAVNCPNFWTEREHRRYNHNGAIAQRGTGHMAKWAEFENVPRNHIGAWVRDDYTDEFVESCVAEYRAGRLTYYKASAVRHADSGRCLGDDCYACVNHDRNIAELTA